MKVASLFRKLVVSLVVSSAVLGAGSAAWADEVRPGPSQEKRSRIDLVIALDTSNSMDGLINSTRQKLWDIVNELATAKPTPILRVGLISYGNDGYQEAGWTRIDQPLTEDLDSVYEKLMGLSTNGGSEYVGRAIDVAHHKMSWRPDRETLKIMFVAGNESADQDREVPSLKAASSILKDDVIVNTIYCGNAQDGDADGWRQVALKADGQFSVISADGGAVVIPTPYDDELAKLGDQLNQTYIAYGRLGAEKKMRQESVDRQSAQMSPSAGASRAAAKGSALYRNDDWDLVDAQKEGRSVEELDAEALPPEMQKMKPAERKAYVDKKAKEREAIQAKINDLNQKRNQYLQDEGKKRSKDKKGSAFDEALKDSLHKQAKRKNIQF